MKIYKCSNKNQLIITEKRLNHHKKIRLAKKFKDGILELDEEKDKIFIDKLDNLIKSKSNIIPGLKSVERNEIDASKTTKKKTTKKKTTKKKTTKKAGDK